MLTAFYFMQSITLLQCLCGDVDLRFSGTGGTCQWLWELCTEGLGTTDRRAGGAVQRTLL